MNSGKPYTVSVRLMTYNHAKYIRQAMESILAQKTDFNVEVVVGDDFSTDGTLDIVREYQSTEKIHIRILERKVGDEYWTKRQKLGRLYNFINILENCTGEYIAFLDGDDFWLDNHKLQKQVDFLRSNSEFILIAGNSKVGFENDPDRSEFFRPSWTACTSTIISIEDQIKYSPTFHISSVLCKNKVLNLIPDFIYKTISGDIVLFTILSSVGKYYYVDNVVSYYRVNNAGITQSYQGYERLRYKYERKVYMYKLLNEHFELKYAHLFNSFIRFYSKMLVKSPRKWEDYFSHLIYLIKKMNEPYLIVMFIRHLASKLYLKSKFFFN